VKEIGGNELIDTAAKLRRAFPDALAEFARLARAVQKVPLRHSGLSESPPSRPKVGRNEPCPCGSGRKYKKCCGASAAH
jgi:uncharacterized protein YecA (UPF0149 family)